jgi:multidrug efflux pump subunit AcrA (membrane-fusion protein)
MRRLVLAFLVLGVGCRKPAATPEAGGEEKGEAGSTPVKVTGVSRASIPQVVTGPGRTVAFLQQKVRAPFSGTLTELKVVDGNRVNAGDVVGVVVSRDSEAALLGANELVRQAKSESEVRDAQRALELAERGLVKAPLKIPSSGVVLAHAASAGDRVSEDQEILTVSTSDSLVFQADIPQTDLGLVRTGQAATVRLSGLDRLVPGLVHDILANANPGDLTVPVRIDPTPPVAGLGVGLFGTARIVVGQRDRVPCLPPAAVITDDITGKSRIAVVTPEGKAHWIEVTTGLSEGDHVEIRDPVLPEGTRVIVSGQIGLPEASPVTVEP